jgi:hypothetical protein
VFESISNSGAPGVVTGLAWKWIAADATPVAAFGDPLHTTGYRLCLYDASGRVSTATAPSGRGWNAAPTTVKYKSKTWAPTGIAGITLKAGLVPGAAKIAVKGKGWFAPRRAVDRNARVALVAQLSHSGGECWEAVFSSPFLVQTSEQFQDRSD